MKLGFDNKLQEEANDRNRKMWSQVNLKLKKSRRFQIYQQEPEIEPSKFVDFY